MWRAGGPGTMTRPGCAAPRGARRARTGTGAIPRARKASGGSLMPRSSGFASFAPSTNRTISKGFDRRSPKIARRNDMSDTTRRDFLKGATTAAVTTAVAPNVDFFPAVHAAGSDAIRVGLIGCGGRGTGAADDV